MELVVERVKRGGQHFGPVRSRVGLPPVDVEFGVRLGSKTVMVGRGGRVGDLDGEESDRRSPSIRLTGSCLRDCGCIVLTAPRTSMTDSSDALTLTLRSLADMGPMASS